MQILMVKKIIKKLLNQKDSKIRTCKIKKIAKVYKITKIKRVYNHKKIATKT